MQATVLKSGISYIAYELNSKHWRQRIGSNAVSAMLTELRSMYEVHTFVAILKTANFRSAALLASLGFHHVEKNKAQRYDPESDESVMMKTLPSI